MAVRLNVVVLLLVTLAICASVANSSPTLDASLGLSSGERRELMDDGELTGSTRRSLQWRTKYISYDAMRKGSIPCDVRGASYYSCNAHGQANPYTRGCTMITKCARNTR